MHKEILKSEIKKNYSKIALEGNNSNTCCIPNDFENSCNSNTMVNSIETLPNAIGYQEKELQSIPKESILGLGCGAPLNFAEVNKGETVIDLGSGAGIDAFLASNMVGNEGKVIGIDMTDEMLERARKVAIKNKYKNVEFRKGDKKREFQLKIIQQML